MCSITFGINLGILKDFKYLRIEENNREYIKQIESGVVPLKSIWILSNKKKRQIVKKKEIYDLLTFCRFYVRNISFLFHYFFLPVSY